MAIQAVAAVAIAAWMGWMVLRDHASQVEMRFLSEEVTALRAVISAGDNGALRVDAETGRIVRINAALCEMLGYEWRQLINQPASVIIPPHMQDRHYAYWKAPDVQERRHLAPVEIVDCKLVKIDGTELKCSLLVEGFRRENGYTWIVSVADDGRRFHPPARIEAN